MPSPFPGMDPFIEGHLWHDFHGSMIFAIRDLLVPSIRPRYYVRTEERIYLNHESEDGRSRHIRPDLLITDTFAPGVRAPGSGSTALVIQPVNITLPMPEEVRERYLAIRDSETRSVVTVIEALSPANKRAGSYDRALYLAKRDEVLLSEVNLVELDLLRAGRRLPAEGSLPPADFYAIVSRAGNLPRAATYPWTLRQPMPSIPVPLALGDDDVLLDLQTSLTTVQVTTIPSIMRARSGPRYRLQIRNGCKRF